MRTRQLIICCAVLFHGMTSCSTDKDESSTNPVFGTWRVVQVQISNEAIPQTTPEDENISLSFIEGGSFTGRTSVNQLSGRYELNDSTLTMLEFTTTEAADTAFAAVFYNAIAEAQVPNETFAPFDYRLSGSNLILAFGDSGQMVLENNSQYQ